MSLALRIANRWILDNTSHHIDPEDRLRVAIACQDDQIEAWITSAGANDPKIFCLKFPGSGGRAERAGSHPGEVLAPDEFETWTINPPGYGTSGGRASVKKMPATCDAAWHAVENRAAGTPIVVAGNSLGCMYALYVAARYPVAGLLLRNPAPVHQLIRRKYSWWNFGLANRCIGRQVPPEMDAVDNASRCRMPALLVTSAADRMISPKIQGLVVDAYAGALKVFTIPDADHHTPIPEDLIDDYREQVVRWGETFLPETKKVT